MSKHKRTAVTIKNPLPGGSRYTTLKSATVMVRDRRIAVFIGPNEIEFVRREALTIDQLKAELVARARQRRVESPDGDREQRHLKLSDISDWRGPRPPADQRPRGDWIIPPGRAVS